MGKNRRKNIVFAALAALMAAAPVSSGAGWSQPVCVQAAQSNNDSRLSELDIYPGTLNPAFSPDVLSYTASVDADVTKVSVRAVPRSAGGTIASVDGAKSLEPGVNTVTVVSAAPDGSSATYTITLTVGNADAQDAQQTAAADEPAQDAGQQTDDTKPADEPADDTKEPVNALVAPIENDGTVTLNGAAYKLSNNFSYGSITQDIPSGFVQASVQIGENSWQSLSCEANGAQLVYLENTDGNGSTGFYYYDETQNAVERFKYMGSDKGFVVFISTPRKDVPAGYAPATLTLPSEKQVTAYQAADTQDMQDFYLVYGLASDGTDGWYQFDQSQATYQRFVQTNAGVSQPEEDEQLERTVSLQKYNALYEKYTDAKNRMVKIVSVLAIGMVLLIIIFTMLLLRGQGEEPDDGAHAAARRKKERRHAETENKQLDKARMQNRHGAQKQTQRSQQIQQPEHIQRPESEPQPVVINQPEHDYMARQRMSRATAPLPTDEAARRGAVSRELLGKEPVSSGDEALRLAEEKMRRSVQLAHKNQQTIGGAQQFSDNAAQSVKEPARTMSDVDREAVFRPTKRMNLEDVPKSERAADDRDAGQTAVGQKRSHRKKRSLVDDDMEIMDLNDL